MIAHGPIVFLHAKDPPAENLEVYPINKMAGKLSILQDEKHAINIMRARENGSNNDVCGGGDRYKSRAATIILLGEKDSSVSWTHPLLTTGLEILPNSMKNSMPPSCFGSNCCFQRRVFGCFVSS